MTEAGKKWVFDTGDNDADEYSETAAEFWIRAFCDEVEKMAKKSDSEQVAGYCYKTIRKKLLGETS